VSTTRLGVSVQHQFLCLLENYEIGGYHAVVLPPASQRFDAEGRTHISGCQPRGHPAAFLQGAAGQEQADPRKLRPLIASVNDRVILQPRGGSRTRSTGVLGDPLTPKHKLGDLLLLG
jgi:hypothetical protein